MNRKLNSAISRREFARRAAIASATALVPANTLAIPAAVPLIDQQPIPEEQKLSPQSHAEAEARYQAILVQYGSRFSEVQKAELRRLSFSAQPGLDTLRAYSVQNGDGPALYLKPLIEHEKKPASTNPAAKSANEAKKS